MMIQNNNEHDRVITEPVNLQSRHEEADTLVAFHAKQSPEGNILIRSTDTDVQVILLGLAGRSRESNIILDYGSGNHRRYIVVLNIAAIRNEKQAGMTEALLGMHVYSMFGFTTSDINEARYKAFIRMSGGDEEYPLATFKKINCASLPPCNKTLGNHVKRAQVVSMNLEESQSDGSNWRGKTHRIRMEREQQPPGARQVSRKVCPRNSRIHS